MAIPPQGLATMQDIQSAAPDTTDGAAAEKGFGVDLVRLEDLKSRTQMELPVNFTFRCHEVQFQAVIRELSGEATVFASAELGSVPFTVEAPDARVAITELLSCKPEVPTARLVRRDHGKIAAVGSILLGGELTTPRIFAATVALAASMRPLIELAATINPKPPARPVAVSI